MVYKSKNYDKKLKSNEKQKRGLWSPEEDEKLRNYVFKHGHGCWSTVSVKAGLQRTGKSCRLRWVNYLRPGLKKGLLTKEEEDIVLSLHNKLGNRWSQISKYLPGRTDNEIKNYWHSYLKKRIITAVKTTSTPNSMYQPTYSPSNSLETLMTTQTSPQNTVGGSSPSDPREHNIVSPHQISTTYLPRLMFAEWFSPDFATNGPTRESNIQDFILQDCLLDETFDNSYSAAIGSIDNIVPDSRFWPNDETTSNEFCNSFSDNIYIHESRMQ
ncbi:PREDICTED: transcription factor LAF1 [Tarenaya hassleriana]|uniref:transcription factor LAF1 n=1 Tax=Tarenaya hassleriana TaxID=28532 RepID=UPI00053C8E7C|nr:PREDICTED: transcription factor LAF1 [Tarenaya hassleriana]